MELKELPKKTGKELRDVKALLNVYVENYGHPLYLCQAEPLLSETTCNQNFGGMNY